MPNYSILVDTRDRLTPQVTYVPQENIEVVVNTQVSPDRAQHLHPLLVVFSFSFLWISVE